ncbi:ABC transporter substrate-binding protein [Candidatus Uabimicrobium sp. HlEnr_7]|uniref:ABC transporter substrate-binding protein n=1 Tax=Candidatus Uabimicrobium helgolandensis TaxID=3095367 RepID=UPI003558EB93
MNKVLFIFLLFVSVYSEEFRVTFVNPGKQGEIFWDQVCDFMKAAAEDLDIDLEILYSERDHLRMIELAAEVCKRQNKPSYLIIVNEKQAAGKMLQHAKKYNVKTFLLLNILTKEQKKVHSTPRKKYSHWIGSLRPDNEKAGFDIAKSLCVRATKIIDGKIDAIGVAGDYVTPASMRRILGLKRLMKRYPQIKLKQVIHSHWQQRKAYRQLKGLLRRYPKTKIIWTANDPMALGAIQAAKEQGLKPGRNIFVGGLNWSKEALEKIVTGDLITSVGGHFMAGGWALVMLRDYHEGRDFAKIGLQQLVYMGTIDRSNVKKYLFYFGDQNWNKINFRKFLRKKPQQKYQFTIQKLFKVVRENKDKFE